MLKLLYVWDVLTCDSCTKAGASSMGKWLFQLSFYVSLNTNTLTTFSEVVCYCLIIRLKESESGPNSLI